MFVFFVEFSSPVDLCEYFKKVKFNGGIQFDIFKVKIKTDEITELLEDLLVMNAEKLLMGLMFPVQRNKNGQN